MAIFVPNLTAPMAKKILVIEDDKDIRDTIVYVLEEEHYEVIASEDAKILKRISDFNPDLILLDNWLTDWKSDANGQQLSKGLKSNPATSHIPVVIISAVSNIKEIAEAGDADGYIRKPFDLTELIDIVKKFAGVSVV
ncbi:Response regulator receiver domain-containing protein [Mucilaginibacter pineti]|uniref:Response regulator receiver domain-containing protein n=2 Tax=Mucilaginibacter pineti TaxID=1391627 RepID=A0A1G6WMK7_9SPHI|nr:Response regulator receiver domain-containing protein [Mucilaginibacter pineti]